MPKKPYEAPRKLHGSEAILRCRQCNALVPAALVDLLVKGSEDPLYYLVCNAKLRVATQRKLSMERAQDGQQ